MKTYLKNGTSKSLKSSSRECTDNVTPLFQPGNNKMVFSQVFRYTDCRVKTDENQLHTGEYSKSAFNNKHVATSGMMTIHNACNLDDNQDLSLDFHKDLSYSSSIGSRNLISEREDASTIPRNKTYHRYSTPKGHYEGAGVGFRRTPGAHRPANQQQNTVQHYQPELKPQFLFRTNAPASRVENGDYVRKNSRNCGVFSEKPQNQPLNEMFDGENMDGVDLIVSNLDYNISTHEWKKILKSEFHNVQIRSLSVQIQANNTSIAIMNVASMEDATYVVSQYHRKKIGYKRIHVTISTSGSQSSPLEVTKSNIINLLNEISGHKLPLIQFFEIFQKKHQKRLSILDLQDFIDCVEVIEQEGLGKMVVLCSEETVNKTESMLTCQLLCANLVDSSFWEGVNFDKNPKVKLLLKGFSSHIHKLLQTHEGGLPLNSFPACYAREFSSLKLVLNEHGVSLEHLITCVPGVEIVILPTGVKQLQWSKNQHSENMTSSPVAGAFSSPSCSGSPILSDQLKQFNHEVCELLRNIPKCSIEISKFLSLYQQYYGKEIKCLDFGYTGLNELLKALSSSIQIVGSGNSSCMIFTHLVQLSRLYADLLKILKVQKQLDITQLPHLYNNVIGKPFDITDFGICFIEDLLTELSSHPSISVTRVHDKMFLSISKKDQSLEEMKNINNYKNDIVSLLRQCPDYSLAYNQFMSAYHKQFGKQFRLVDCGFANLSEYFAAVSDSIKVTQHYTDKYLSLCEMELIQILKEEIIHIFNTSSRKSMHISELSDLYAHVYGHPWNLNNYGVAGFAELIEKMAPDVIIEGTDLHQVIVFKVPEIHEERALSVLLILMDLSDGQMMFDDLCQAYHNYFNDHLTESFLTEHMGGLVSLQKSSLEESFHVKLMPAQMFARDVRLMLLSQPQQQIPLPEFEQSYTRFFKVPIDLDFYCHRSIASLFHSASKVITYDGCLSNWNICLKPKFQMCLKDESIALPTCTKPLLIQSVNHHPSMKTSNKISHKVRTNVALEALLAMPGDFALHSIPSTPKPSSTQVSTVQDHLSDLELPKDVEKGLRTPLCQTPIYELMAYAVKLLPKDVLKYSHLERRIERINNLQLNDRDQSELTDISLLADLNNQSVEGSLSSDVQQHTGVFESIPSSSRFKDDEFSTSTRYGLYGSQSSIITPSQQINTGDQIASDGPILLDVPYLGIGSLPKASINSMSTPFVEKSQKPYRLTSNSKSTRIMAKFNLTS